MPGSTAARVAGWQRRYGGSWAVPSVAPSETQQPVRVELFLGGQWVDITRVSADQPGVFYDDAITISRGRPDEASTADTSRCTFTLNNAGGWFSPRNPRSPYYGQLTRNTPIRVSVLRRGVRRFRFHGEVTAWPQKWEETGRHVRVPIEAAGIVRRLTQGASPLHSTLRRGLLSRKVTNLRAYWPCEDQDGSTSLASALGGKPMRIRGTPSLASFSDFGASDAIPSLNDSEWTGVVPSYPAGSAIQLRFLMAVPASAAANDQSVVKLFTSGTAQVWHLVYKAVGDLTLEAYSGNDLDTLIGTSADIVFGVNGKLLRVSVQLTQDGSNVDWLVATLEPGRSTGLTASGTLSNRTIKQAKRIVVNNGGGLADVAIGHISVQSSTSSIFDLGTELAAYTGERAWTRIKRLCSENDIEFAQPDDTRTGITVGSQRMGVQLPKSLIDLLRECADTDGGILREERDQLGLGYRVITTLYNQDPKVSLDYSAAHLVPPLEPVDDDQATRNDVTATRERGSSARITIDEGPLSVQPPPDGVGTYDDAVTLSAASDEQMPNLASWRAHLGTVDEARFPVVNVHLDRPQITGDVDLENSLLTVDLGDRLDIENPPAWLPPEPVSQIVQGYTETITGLEHKISFNCSPAAPYETAMWDSVQSPYGNAAGDRYDTVGSELAADVTDSATTLSVATTVGPIWTQAVADFPFDVMVGGERMTVTAVSGASSPQTFTVTRSVNDISKPHAAGTVVRLFQPAYRAL